MKPYALILLCSGVAVGQRTSSTSKAPENGRAITTWDNLPPCPKDCLCHVDGPPECVVKPKPHKAKTPAKPLKIQCEGSCDPGPVSQKDVLNDEDNHLLLVRLPEGTCEEVESWRADPKDAVFNRHQITKVDCPVKPSDLSATMEALAPTKWSCTTDATENRVVIVCEKGSK